MMFSVEKSQFFVKSDKQASLRHRKERAVVSDVIRSDDLSDGGNNTTVVSAMAGSCQP